LPPACARTGGTHFCDKLWALNLALPHLHPATTALATASMLLVIAGPLLPSCRRIPGPRIALLGAAWLQALRPLPGVVTIGSAFGGIPQGLPHFVLPTFGFDQMVALLSSAFTIAMLGATESLLSAVVTDGVAGMRHDPNQALIGQGIANILCPLFGGIAATGAIARTTTNARNGGTSPLAGVIHSPTLVLDAAAPGAARGTHPALFAGGDPVRGVVAHERRGAFRAHAAHRAVGRCGDPSDHLHTHKPALAHTHTDPRCMILRLGRVPFMDITGIQALQESVTGLERRGVRVVFCDANMRVIKKLLRAGVVRRGSPKAYFGTLQAALAETRR
jgi:MFS superfamily sulfate permease-like transporter